MKNKYLIAIRITCVLLCILLLGGVAVCLVVQNRRAENAKTQKYRDYALWLWADEDAALLWQAAQKNNLYFNIAVDYVRQLERKDTNGKDVRNWVAYDLHRQKFIDHVEPLLSQIHVPVQDDEYFYSDLRIYRPLGEALGSYPPEEKISLQYNSGGYSLIASILKYPERRMNRRVNGHEYELITTVTTADGHDINYYSYDTHYDIRSDGMDCIWGEVYADDDQPQYFTVGVGPEFKRGFGIPTTLEQSSLTSYTEHLEHDEALQAALKAPLRTVSMIYCGIWVYIALLVAAVILLIVFHLLYRKGYKASKYDKYKTGIRAGCLILALLFVIGGLAYSAYASRRAEREEYYATTVPELSTGFDDMAEDYYLWLWSDEEMALLQWAADENALYYEIAADYVRHWRADEVDGYVDWSWLPYDLDRKTYQREVGALLEQLYVPFLPDFHANEFDYGDIRVHRKSGLVADAASSKISVNLRENEKATGDFVCSSSVAILFDPQRRIDRGSEKSGFYELYDTITTTDGYEVNYYTWEFANGTLMPGSSWGEVWIAEDAPQYFNVACYEKNTMPDQMIHSLKDSKLISYAEHLRTNPEVEERVSTQWRTISLIYYGVILYGLLTVAAVGTIIACTMLYRKEKRTAHKE